MKLNLGSGGIPLDDYVNVDIHCPAEIQGDIRDLDFEDVEEVRMDHLLEHISHTQTNSVLRRIHGWMRPGGLIRVEVPDMEAIMANPGPSWVTDIYGTHSHIGEHHMAGFTHHSLRHALIAAGFSEVRSTCFISAHPNRPGMPCIEASGRA